MGDKALVERGSKHIRWFEEEISVRGCRLSLDKIKSFYRELDASNNAFGEQLVGSLPKDPERTDEQWEDFKQYLIDQAFRLTVRVTGMQDQQLVGDNAEVFDDPDLPNPIKSIYFTNTIAYEAEANGTEPRNAFSVTLDFDKPDVFDPHPLVSAETPNSSGVWVKAQDVTFFHSVVRTVEKKLTSHKTWYAPIHRNFTYDFGLWFVALPLSLYFSAFYMDKLIPDESEYSLFRWPLFIYFSGLCLLFYRGLVAYAKWAFPVNVLEDNRDRALRHRVILGAIGLWLFTQVASTIYGLIV